MSLLDRLLPRSITVRRSVNVDEPADAVWAAVADLPRWPERDSYIQWVRPAEGQPADEPWWTVGRRYREQVRRGPFRPEFDLEVVECEPGRRVGWAATYLWVRGHHAWYVDPRPDGGSTLTSEETFTGPRPFLLIARIVFRLFDVERMTDRQIGFMAADANRYAGA